MKTVYGNYTKDSYGRPMWGDQRRAVAVVSDDGAVITFSVCSYKDQFVKRIGRAIAIARNKWLSRSKNEIMIRVPAMRSYPPAFWDALQRSLESASEIQLREESNAKAGYPITPIVT